MTAVEPLYLSIPDDELGRELVVTGSIEREIEVSVYQARKSTSNYRVRLTDHEAAALAIELLGHLRDKGLAIGLTS